MRVVVVGAGVSGLVAARDLAKAGAEVTVLEATDLIGGKLRTAEVAGVTVDVGAEATLARRPEALELFAELGLTPIHPTAAGSRIWVRDVLRPMPPSLMGAPSDFGALEASGILTAAGLERARAEADLAAEPLEPGEDIGVGEYLEARFGPEVVDTLVDPLLGGVYAGQARQISLRAAVPQLAAMATRGPLGPQLAALPPRTAGPVFAGLAGGMGQLPAVIARGLDIRLGADVTGLQQIAGGWRIEVASAEAIEADAVVLATQAWVTAGLLDGHIDDQARDALAQIDYASVAVITLAFTAADLDVEALQGELSGFLVPPTETLEIKASTFSFAKWEWVRAAGEAAGVLHLRTSVGRHGDNLAVDLSDAELLTVSLKDLKTTTGLTAAPVDVHVQRWERGLPQYAIGHLDRVAQIQAAVAQLPGIALAGAAYEGVGVPAVIASGRRAAAGLLTSAQQS